MKKNIDNNKGFMLVEVIIVTVVVATIMMSLYVAFNRIYTAYEIKNKYTNVDAIYAASSIEYYLIDNLLYNDLFSRLDSVGHIKISCSDTSLFNNINTQKYCSSIFTNYNVNEIYFVNNNKNALNNFKNSINNDYTFQDFLTYLSDAGIIGTTGYNGIFVLKLGNEQYGYLLVK